jgi:hypothetical protein
VLNMHDFYYYGLSLPMQRDHRINQLRKTSLPLDEHFKLVVVWCIPTLWQTVKILHKAHICGKKQQKTLCFLLQQKIAVP